MAAYVHFTEEQKERANSVNLVDFLQRQGEALERSGNEWRWKSHRSVTIKGNRWYRHSIKEGSCAIDFVKEFYGLSFSEAVTYLLGGETGAAYDKIQEYDEKKEKQFTLPPKNDGMRRVYAYLMTQRFISREVLHHFAKQGTLYEDSKYHNAVFVGVDKDGIPRHAHKKGTYTEGESFRANEYGSNPSYGFGHTGKGEKLYVFEAPIDFLSFLTLYPKDWERQSYIVLNGVGEHAMLQMLKDYPQVKEVIFCLDHDAAGIEACGRLAELIRETENPILSILQPKNKDWNEDLKETHGITPIPAEEHPKILECQEWCRALTEVGSVMDEKYEQIEMFQAYHSKFFKAVNAGRKEWDYGGRIESECMHLSCVSGKIAQRYCRELGRPVTSEQIFGKLSERYRPHKDKGKLPRRLENIQRSILEVTENQNRLAGLEQSASGDVSGTFLEDVRKAKENLIKSHMNLMAECIQVHIFMETEIRQKEKLEQEMQNVNGMELV